ncbi:cell division protein FtsL [Virgibacillus salarius]|uniref:cell division protein FtsL n=1 Tax=Virgibacillus salarius TaxID=447199 RepID=UPI00248FC26D|nr:cell division protein FtsL [Virgibacillus salarius]WBX79655.1 cell division protein FtsL [Virgibacillus salarius]
MSVNHARSWEQIRPQQTPKKEQSIPVKVQKQGWITKGEKLIYSIIGVCIIVAGLYMVSFSSSTDTVNRELQQLESKVKLQQAVNDQLSYELKELSRPERIINMAEKNGLKIQDTKVKQAQKMNN